MIRQCKLKKHNGFTLIELLVVISIIGLLSTFALVSLTNSRKQSRDTKRMSDLKTIQTAIEMYISQNNELPGIKNGMMAIWEELELNLQEYIVGGKLPLPSHNDTCEDDDPNDFIGDCYLYCASKTGSLHYLLGAQFEQNGTISGDIDGITDYSDDECAISQPVLVTENFNCGDGNENDPPRFCVGSLSGS